ncbi:MAG: hypothetical protein ACI4PT_02380 [Candidatus Avoscillospira sp.]
MDEEKNRPEEKGQSSNNRRARNPNGVMGFRMAAIFVVLYMLYQVVRDYIKGGPDAPSVFLLILAIVVLGGGSIGLAITSYKLWKDETKKEPEEEPEAEQATEEQQSEESDV